MERSISERRNTELEPFLGNRYPATDIPQIARRLYMRNRVRVLVDVEAAPVPLTPRFSPFTHQDLDMSMCFLRTMSPSFALRPDVWQTTEKYTSLSPPWCRGFLCPEMNRFTLP